MPPKPDDRPIVVVKVGGSLLDWTPLIARLEKYLTQSVRDARVVLIVGGGRSPTPCGSWTRRGDSAPFRPIAWRWERWI
ncbi:hypothetical protein [Planctomyces sp. SH-PL62]|uniref:hypothetical protein n=1 Tax=Planctomyces sp. SH-PL62 TaxID=1636152 RepID=UPI00078BADF9|nr:hypothetical protein [Planctomyces sp. SH-PL62]AMV36864.1 hypothetical protein VT85_05500 [Planctomyces sp. SH-PL62]